METVRNDLGLGELVTEARHPAHADLARSTSELVALMNEADATVAAAVARAHDGLVSAIDAIAPRFEAGGRIVYVGAGTSGRLALVDAVECQSTFAIPPGRVIALLAGGAGSPAVAQEHAEDDAEAGARELRELTVGSGDVVVGISASGRTSYVVGALEEAGRAGVLSVAVVCVAGSELARLADHDVAVVVGGELIAGSTRLKAGTAQKLVLNTISTVTMVRVGKTFGNLMVDVVATNEKLRGLVRRIVALATGEADDRVDEALRAAGGDAKVAIVSLLAGIDADSARERLARAQGVVRKALES